MELRRVVITGIGTINSLGHNVPEYFDSLIAGKSGAGLITRFDASLFKTRFACEIKDYDPEKFGLDRREAHRNDPFAQYALIATDEAIKDSGLDLDAVDKDLAGVVVGSGIGGIETLLKEILEFYKGGSVPRFSPFLVPMMIPDMASGMISMKYGLRGPNYATVSACSTSNHAMSDAFTLIRMGKANIIVTGGAEAPINVASIGGFNAAKAISTNNDEFASASRPFDKTRDGFVMGEGAGILVFEEYEHAKARGARIYAEVGGSGMTADAYHITAPHPDGDGARRVMEEAIRESGLKPQEVDYINLHGTSTPLGDIVEAKAIRDLFGDHAYTMNLSSTKSMAGHALGATGAIEILACICAMEREMIPPTINFKEEDPAIDYRLNFTFNQAQPRKVRVALSNTFGFGGHNSSLLIKKI
ncbi:MAG: beta-ketoacyl-ACP synthase II [Bacteroidales bacterium]|jgi:3-oxoacyl-[acyl-carrier-protein] synthase II|nr:beta-ketoacyl-ACP synthase II [Bacteroidales bacterium]MDD2823919.1 beta-ketoacyl-ACP synthase II [Bacteroidales bacterium]MDD3099938.1 beta-ketoacyl-ACP synthase II [Bacteroidales bacterium]MDD3638782.1 beta-ketoacyl-ACP synthase II [Bacteroidales bacterium]MDD3943439.1 beta-ketoacyl-ACP synthase II [Bacteroidales bacterium]